MLRVSEEGRHRGESYLESYRQLGRSLADLEIAADQVFDRISQRTAEETEKLNQISRRIQSAKASIDAISRSKQPLVIKSPSKYPSSCVIEEDFQPLFHYTDGNTDGGLPKTLLVNGGLNREFGNDGTLELFQFFSEENTACPSSEAQLKVGVKPSRSSEATFLSDLLEECDSYQTGSSNTSVSKIKTKKQELPPAPPSLFLHNIPLLRKADAAASIKPAQIINVPDAPSDTHQRNDAHSE